MRGGSQDPPLIGIGSRPRELGSRICHRRAVPAALGGRQGVHLAVRPDRDPAGPARRLRDPGPLRRRQPQPARQQPGRGALQRRDPGADRARLHAGLRDHRADQLRPRRGLHARLARGRRRSTHVRPHAATGDRRPGARPRGDPGAGDARQRLAQRDDRAGGLPAAASGAQARAADHGGRACRSSCRTSASSGSARRRRASPTCSARRRSSSASASLGVRARSRAATCSRSR